MMRLHGVGQLLLVVCTLVGFVLGVVNSVAIVQQRRAEAAAFLARVARDGRETKARVTHSTTTWGYGEKLTFPVQVYEFEFTDRGGRTRRAIFRENENSHFDGGLYFDSTGLRKQLNREETGEKKKRSTSASSTSRTILTISLWLMRPSTPVELSDFRGALDRIRTDMADDPSLRARRGLCVPCRGRSHLAIAHVMGTLRNDRSGGHVAGYVELSARGHWLTCGAESTGSPRAMISAHPMGVHTPGSTLVQLGALEAHPKQQDLSQVGLR